MDWNVIIPSLITGVVAVIGSVLGFIGTLASQRKKNEETRQAQFDEVKNTMSATLTKHREEYLKGIQDVKDLYTDLKSAYDKSTSVISIQIKQLEDKQDKHNSVIERTYALEKDVAVLKNRNSVSEHRLTDLENDGK